MLLQFQKSMKEANQKQQDEHNAKEQAQHNASKEIKKQERMKREAAIHSHLCLICRITQLT